uniref:Uncharacterized protein n=1 Tax=Glossina brevipalpis TaxID=37001 RepID=A0A1A9WLQ2_9MUSC
MWKRCLEWGFKTKFFQEPPENIPFEFLRSGEHFVNYLQTARRILIASISVPITELLPERSFFIDWCFQMSYDLPHSLSSFYNTPIWPDRKKSKHQKRETNVMNQTLWDKYNTITFAKRHPSDFTIEELYQGIENILESYGYDASCLLLSICELARHPFADDHINILTNILTFVLSPSLHGDFDHYKQLNYEIYKAAELNGFLDRNCSNIYFEFLGVTLPIILASPKRSLRVFYNIQLQYVPPPDPIYWWSFLNSTTFESRYMRSVHLQMPYDKSRSLVYEYLENIFRKYK